jgi:hypothetical protein
VAVGFSICSSVIGTARVLVVIRRLLVQVHGIQVEIKLICRLRLVSSQRVTIRCRSMLAGESVG